METEPQSITETENVVDKKGSDFLRLKNAKVQIIRPFLAIEIIFQSLKFG